MTINKNMKSANREQRMKARSDQAGFTLVEMAVVMVIIGVILVAGLKLYDNYITHQRVVTTSSNVSLASRAVSDFRARFGRYPCPAPLTIARGSPDYGREGDCNPNNMSRDTLTAVDEAPANNPTPGTFADGYAVEQSARMVDTDGDLIDDTRPLVVRGAIPFRDLNLPEDFAYDGYGSRIVYAVTQRAAVQDTFNPRQGGISIVDTQATPQSVVETPDSALFVVLSPGMDGDGAYSREGVQIQACPTATGDIEKENCDLSTAEAKYVHIARQTVNGNDYFDDNLAYYSGVEDSLWEIAEADKDDIILRQDGRVNVNVKDAASALPNDSIYVNGVIRAMDNYLAQEICNTGGTDCFTPDKIGGALADGGGMECPPGQYMYGISAAAPLCSPNPPVSEVRCPAGQFVIGMDTDGTLKCSTPPLQCPSEDRTICGVVKTLPTAVNGASYTLTAGDSRAETYRCAESVSGGTGTVPGTSTAAWSMNPVSASGLCTCNPTETETYRAGCGTGYSGTRPMTRTRTCPSGDWTPWSYNNAFDSDCTCIGYRQYRWPGCGSGYNSGSKRQYRDWTCDSSNNLVGSGWVDDINTCACVPQTVNETNITCEGGLDGTYSRTRSLVCPGATWTPWVYDYSGCTCNSSKTRTRVVACPPGQLGSITQEDSFICSTTTSGDWANNWLDVPGGNTCATPPPTICVWKPVGTPVQVTTQPSVPRAGKECACGSGSGSCYEYGDPNYLKYNLCSCE